jgi:large subunit ribosomal protein L18e
MSTTNLERIRIIKLLHKKARENNAQIWKELAKQISAPKRRRISVNISRVNRYTKKDDMVVVAGKVLSSGVLTHPVTIAAFSFSTRSKEKIEKSGGKCLTIEELVSQNPSGSNVKIIR